MESLTGYGWLLAATPIGSWFALAAGVLTLGFLGAPFAVWTLGIAAALWLMGAPIPVFGAVTALFVLLNLPPIRRSLLSIPVAKLMDKLKLMPVISETERVALEAGTTWVDAELFSGKPDYNMIRKEPYSKLPAHEQAFIENQVKTVCSMASDWEIYKNKDLPPAVWDYLKKERFFGMIVPKEFGGLGFTAAGHSEVIAHLATHSGPLAITVMVPNSLGPAELLAHYGTDKQKQYYLPRLARGEEIPCFALTEPNAGSDAGSLQSSATVFRGEDGNLYLRLNWEKRYITLAAVATLVGLAVRLYDPENLLGKGNT